MAIRYDLGINPVNGIAFFPVDKKLRYVPTPSDVQLVILHARADDWLMKRYPDGADYLETLRDTLARMSEVNQLKWTDVDLAQKHLILFTRKIDGGLTPRKIPLTNRLYEILSRMKTEQGSGQASGPWVFPNPRTGKPYSDRKGIMRRLCKKAEIPYFRFHAIRHAGASLMDNANVPMGEIQKVLGHKNRSTTEIYLHPSGQGSREVIDALEAVTQSTVKGMAKAVANDKVKVAANGKAKAQKRVQTTPVGKKSPTQSPTQGLGALP